MQVTIGVDPHKASHTAVAISTAEDELARKKVRATRAQVEQLLAWAEPFPTRVWAIEGADGMGYLLAQQLVATGEHVVNVPATLAARTRVLGSGRSNKTDPNDALSVAVTALRTRDLRPVRLVGHSDVLRLLAKRNTDIGDHRTRLVCRMHALLLELTAGGIAKEINASDVDRFLAEVTPATPAEQVRYDLAVELLEDIRRLDDQLKAPSGCFAAVMSALPTGSHSRAGHAPGSTNRRRGVESSWRHVPWCEVRVGPPPRGGCLHPCHLYRQPGSLSRWGRSGTGCGGPFASGGRLSSRSVPWSP